MFWLKSLLLAMVFLTRLPIPIRFNCDDALLKRSAAWFPLVGLLIGGLLLAVFELASLAFSVNISVLITLVASVLLTGVFHEDGLADSADGLGGAFERARKLEIMKDSRLGTYGAMALLLAVLLRWQLLVELQVLLIALPLAHCLSRLAPVYLMIMLPYVSGEQSKSRDMVQSLTLADLTLATLTALLPLIWVPWQQWLAAVVAIVCVLPLAYWFFKRQLQGITGDTLGATQQVSELVILAVLLAVFYG